MNTASIAWSASLILLSLATLTLASREDDLRTRFEGLDDKRDHAAIVKLWKEHPTEALGTIDAYLEGSLKLLEDNRDAAPDVILSMEARALRGAAAADEAFGTAIFADYAAAFGSWNADEQGRFRRGQALFGEASKALRSKNFDIGLSKATESLELARPLGDWWGTAMALCAMGRAHAGLGQPLKALECASQARLINHDLRLSSDEYTCLEVMTRAAEASGRNERALVSAQAASAFASQLGDAKGAADLEKVVVELKAKLGR